MAIARINPASKTTSLCRQIPPINQEILGSLVTLVWIFCQRLPHDLFQPLRDAVNESCQRRRIRFLNGNYLPMDVLALERDAPRQQLVYDGAQTPEVAAM